MQRSASGDRGSNVAEVEQDLSVVAVIPSQDANSKRLVKVACGRTSTSAEDSGAEHLLALIHAHLLDPALHICLVLRLLHVLMCTVESLRALYFGQTYLCLTSNYV